MAVHCGGIGAVFMFDFDFCIFVSGLAGTDYHFVDQYLVMASAEQGTPAHLCPCGAAAQNGPLVALIATVTP